MAQGLYISDKKMILSRLQRSVFIYLVTKIKPSDHEFSYQKINMKSLCDTFHINFLGGKNRKMVFQSIWELREKSVNIGDCYNICLIDKNVTLEKSKSCVCMKLHSDLKKYLLNIDCRYTYYQLGYICNFKQKYTWRVYDFCHSWLEKGDIKISMDLVCKLFGFATYGTYKEINARILKTACEEINTYTDITVEINPNRNGKIVSGIIIKIDRKVENELEDIDKNFCDTAEYTELEAFNELIDYIHSA